MRICVFEDAAVEQLAPLTLTRPAFALWCGAGTLLQRQMRTFLTTAVGALVRPFLAPLARQDHPAVAIHDPDWLREAPLVWVNARWLVPEQLPTRLGRAEVGCVADQIAYMVPPGDWPVPTSWEELPAFLDRGRRELPHRAAGGVVLRYPWDLVEQNAAALEQDFQVWQSKRQCLRSAVELAGGPVIVGSAERLLVSGSACLEAPVVIDTTGGPVLIDRQAVIHAFTRLEGPCYIGPRSRLRGATVRHSSIGPECRVGGEVEASIFQGTSNKAHDGFLGHSYVGAWVNLAAGTQVSDLRTDYRTVAVLVGDQPVDTGLLKVGAFLGDYTQTGLGALLNTGTLAGPFAQLLPGAGLLPRRVPPFCRVRHGQLHERTDLRQLFATAATSMERRGCRWTETHAETYFDLYDRTTAQRRQSLQDSERRRLKQVV